MALPPDDGLPAEIGWMLENLSEVSDELQTGHWITEVMARVLTRQSQAQLMASGDDAYAWRAPEGSFDYITIDIPRFLRLLRVLHRALLADPDFAQPGLAYRPLKFLEIGCGPGRNLALIRDGAPILWAELTGIDISEPLIRAGQATVGPDVTLLVADAMEFDVSGYDVIFSYRPFRDEAMQLAYEERLRRQMRRSAYLVAPLAINNDSSNRMAAIDKKGEVLKKLA